MTRAARATILTAPSLGRLALVGAAVAFAVTVRVVYGDVIATTAVFEYMGVRAFPTTWLAWMPFLALAALPATWLPLHLEAPSDLLELYLYFAVHVPTAAMMPLVSTSPDDGQLRYCAAITGALLVLRVRRRWPVLRAPSARPSRTLFVGTMAFVCLAVVGLFARSGYLSGEHLSLVDVYGQRAELKDRAAELGRAFFYAANWTGVAIAPFLLAVGLHRKRYALAALGVGLAFASFVVSSNRMNYLGIPAVIGGYYFLRLTKGRHFAAAMGWGFVALSLLLVAADFAIGISAGDVPVPALTWQVFHRTFSNNGFLSAIYLDTFRTRPAAYYADGILRWLPGPRLEAAVPLIAGGSFTDVPDNFANANLWADAYANLGYLGMLVMAAFTAAVFWVYDGLSRRADVLLATVLLLVPATVLANTATQTALTSNGVLLVFVIVWACPPLAERRRGAMRAQMLASDALT